MACRKVISTGPAADAAGIVAANTAATRSTIRFMLAPPSGFETALQRGLHDQSLEREVDEEHRQRNQGRGCH